MTKTSLRLLAAIAALGIFSSITANTQTPATGTGKAVFEVASIRPNKSGDGGMTLRSDPGGRFTATNTTVRTLIINAYPVRTFQILGGPDWIDTERFDVIAKSEAPEPTREQSQQMMRGLLAERFGLVVHSETRDMPIYALVLATPGGKLGPQLRPSDIDCDTLDRTKKLERTALGVMPCRMTGGPGRLRGSAMKMEYLVGNLSYSVNREVVNRTGLTGAFDVDLQWARENVADSSLPSLFTAVQEQLGLKLESARGPVEVLVIDRVERPTPD